jgi:RNA polymerase sigma-70 factor (ECF subfamily)
MNDLDEIIAKILEGDVNLYARVVEAYEGRVRALISAMIPDADMAKDMTQEVFIIAYQRLSTYRRGTNFVAWLRTIARNVAQNERRNWYRRHEMEERYEAEVAQQIEENVDRLVETLPEDLINQLQDCVGKLNGKAHRLMDGFYYKQHSVNELANLLQLSSSAVKVILHRARQAVGSCLQRKGRCDV